MSTIARLKVYSYTAALEHRIMAKGEDFNVKEVKQGGGADLYREVDSRPQVGGIDTKLHASENVAVINDQMASFKSGNLQPSEQYAKLRNDYEDKVYAKKVEA
jgi:hypothetical protein